MTSRVSRFAVTAFTGLLLAGRLSIARADNGVWTPGPGKIWTNDSVGIGLPNPNGQFHIFGGATLFTANATSGSGSGLYLSDTQGSQGYDGGVSAVYTGNSLIVVSHLQLGYLNQPIIQSTASTLPLYLNPWMPTDVIVSQAGYN